MNEQLFLETVEKEGFDYAVRNFSHLMEESPLSAEFFDYMDAREAFVNKINSIIRDNIEFSEFGEIE